MRPTPVALLQQAARAEPACTDGRRISAWRGAAKAAASCNVGEAVDSTSPSRSKPSPGVMREKGGEYFGLCSILTQGRGSRQQLLRQQPIRHRLRMGRVQGM